MSGAARTTVVALAALAAMVGQPGWAASHVRLGPQRTVRLPDRGRVEFRVKDAAAVGRFSFGLSMTKARQDLVIAEYDAGRIKPGAPAGNAARLVELGPSGVVTGQVVGQPLATNEPLAGTAGDTGSTVAIGANAAVAGGWRTVIAYQGAGVSLTYRVDAGVTVTIDGAFDRVISPTDVREGIADSDVSVNAGQALQGKGTVALAILPCQANGYGNATIDGGGRHADLACTAQSSALLVAPLGHKVTWTLTGDWAGSGAGATRLLTMAVD